VAREKTIKEIASLIGAELLGDESLSVSDVASIEDAGAFDITFAATKRHLNAACKSLAAAIIAPAGSREVPGKTLLLVKNPQQAFASVIDLMRPLHHPAPGIDATSSIKGSATIGENVSIGAHVVIEEGVTIARGVVIYPGAYIGRGCSIGEGSIIYPNVSIMEDTIVGKNVIIHPSAVIGSDGFGYARVEARNIKIPQRGRVVIGDEVEIGAGATIDRATIGETRIGRGTKIDNLVQVAHNVTIGEDSLIVAQVGISGSTKIGRRVTIAGQSGLAGHIEIADDCIIGARSGVTGNVKERGIYTGYPLMPHPRWLRTQGAASKLPEMRRRLIEAETRLRQIEEKLQKIEDPRSK